MNLPLRSAALVILTLVVLVGSATGGEYGNCYWDGTPPICAGSCKRGFVVRDQKGCTFGRKVLCCEPMGSTQSPPKTKKPIGLGSLNWKDQKDFTMKCRAACLQAAVAMAPEDQKARFESCKKQHGCP